MSGTTMQTWGPGNQKFSDIIDFDYGGTTYLIGVGQYDGSVWIIKLDGSGDVEGFGEDLAVRLGTDLRTLRQSLAAVAEFKGEVYGHGDVAGVVRFVAVNESTCLVEGAVQGLVPHGKYAVTVRTYGDTTRGVASTGDVFDCENDENENEDRRDRGDRRRRRRRRRDYSDDEDNEERRDRGDRRRRRRSALSPPERRDDRRARGAQHARGGSSRGGSGRVSSALSDSIWIALLC